VVLSAVEAAGAENDAEHRGLCYLVVDAVLNRDLARAIKVKYMVNITELIKMSRDPAVKQSFRKGEKEGEARGEARGEAKGTAKSILTVLRLRGIKVGAEASQRIARCTDLAKLDRWLKQAMTVESAEELFSSPPGKRTRRS
jgi:predicted transposase YdaD